MTAATRAGSYLTHGDTSPLLASVVVGMLIGSYAGAHWLTRLRVTALR